MELKGALRGLLETILYLVLFVIFAIIYFIVILFVIRVAADIVFNTSVGTDWAVLSAVLLTAATLMGGRSIGFFDE